MKKSKLIIIAALMMLLGISGVAPAWATSDSSGPNNTTNTDSAETVTSRDNADATTNSDITASPDFDPTPSASARTSIQSRTTLQDTFSLVRTGSDTVELQFGSNLLLAGNFVSSDKISHNSSINGLLFSAGNKLNLGTNSEYAFIAGNTIYFDGEVEKDLFVAGNDINILNDAKIGRDVFATGNFVQIDTDIPGNLSIAAERVILKNVHIEGDFNLDTNLLFVVDGTVKIDGKLIINSDATIDGLDKISYKEIEKYEVIEYTPTATEILTGKIISIISLFIAFAIIMAMFPGVKGRVAKELNPTQFGKDILIGLAVLVFVPIIAIFLLISFVGAPAALLLLGVYVATIYLAQGYAGLWLGKLIVEKLSHSQLNDFLEMLIGITLIALLTMIPWAGAYIWLLADLLGLGLFMQSIKPNRTPKSPASATKSTKPQSKTPKTKPVEAEVVTTKPKKKSKTDQTVDEPEQDSAEEE